jgi:DNA-binding transcriptional LysR family regulator
MRLESLKIFCDAVELRSFSAAGNLNALSAAEVTQIIRDLEDYFQTEFFERGRKTLTLTAEGELFDQAARPMVGLAREAHKRRERPSEGNGNTL